MKLLISQLAFVAFAALVLFGTALCARLRKRRTHGLAVNVGETTHASSISKLTDAAITTRNLHYKPGSDANHIAVGGAADKPWGIVEDEASAAEELVTVQLLGKGGTKKMVASEAIATNDEVFTAASGKVQDRPTTTGTYWRIGSALTAAAADGDIIEVVDCVPEILVIP